MLKVLYKSIKFNDDWRVLPGFLKSLPSKCRLKIEFARLYSYLIYAYPYLNRISTSSFVFTSLWINFYVLISFPSSSSIIIFCSFWSFCVKKSNIVSLQISK